MLTYSLNSSSVLPRPTEKPWLLLLLALLWLWPGILGHDPWRPGEPYVLAVIDTMLKTGNWMYPAIQDQPHLSYPPLYYWVSAACVKVFSPWLLPMHDAARLATPFFMMLALSFAGGCGRELIGRRHGRSVVLIMIGCLGLIDTGHQLTPVVAEYMGYVAAFYALVIGLRWPALGGALLGAASAVLFLSSSVLQLGLVWLVVICLPVFSAWRCKRYAITVVMALLCGLPLVLIWPMSLLRAYPSIFKLWWYDYALGPLDGFNKIGLFHDIGYYFVTSLWYTWPAWPLAAWTLYRSRRYKEPVLQLPLMFFVMITLLLMFSGHQSPGYVMPLLLPMSILAAIELDTIKRGAAAFLNWFGLMTFGFFGLVLWLGWAALHFGWPSKLAERAYYLSPYYQPKLSILATLTACAATVIWGWAVTRRNLRGRQAITNWAAGITLFWWLLAALALPWLDAFKSYRPVVERMEIALPKEARCVGVAATNLLARVSWEYYAHRYLHPYGHGQENQCDYRLVIRTESTAWVAEPEWLSIWSGGRPRDKEVFVLQRRIV